MLKLHIGCGNRKLNGFLNIDIEGDPDLQIDVRDGLPFPDESVDFIFAEHFIEHLTRDEGILFLKEAYRVLKPGGVCRIATPDLSVNVEQYLRDSWQSAEWIHRFHYQWVPNRCVMLNLAMREWGHKHLYDFEDLKMVGNLAGFLLHRRQSVGQSDFPELRNLEHRSESLVVEFIKETPRYREELPLVSICIPAYNPRFLRETLLSVINQSYLNFEIIVVDDSTSSEIQKIVESFSGSQLYYFKNPSHAGAWKNYFRCLEHANGQYIKYLNDDDLLQPQCLKVMVSYMEAYGKRVTLVTSKRNRIDEKGGALDDTIDTQPLVSVDSYIRGLELGNFVLVNILNLIGEPTSVMFRKDDTTDLEQSFDQFYPDQPGIVDVAMWLALLAKGDAIYITQPLTFFRQHSQQVQRDPQKIFYFVQGWYYLITRSKKLGYLQEDSLYKTSLVRMVAVFQSWLQNFPFREDQKIKLQKLIRKTQEELKTLNKAQFSLKRLQFYPVIREADLYKPPISSTPEKQYEVIQQLCQKGFIDESIDALEKFVTVFPNIATAFNDLGVLYFFKGDVSRAIENLRECLKRDPNHVDALQNIRDILEKLGEENGYQKLPIEF